MLTKFWESLAGKLAEHWSTRLFTPAFGFWAGGLLAWLSGRPGGLVANLDRLGRQLTALPVPAQVAGVVAVFLLLVGSATVADQLTPPTLRLLEGDWPGPIARRVAGRWRARQYVAEQRFAELVERQNSYYHDERDRAQLEDLDRLLRRNPPVDQVRATRLGNTLRRVETWPRSMLGLDTTVCWPYLWLLLDKDTRDQVAESRAAINTAARSWLWGAMFAVWGYWAWWAFPVALIVMCSSYYLRAISAAETYGSMVEAAFVLNRLRLYRALRWPTPLNPEDEWQLGKELTKYLARGVAPTGLSYDQSVDPPPTGTFTVTRPPRE